MSQRVMHRRILAVTVTCMLAGTIFGQDREATSVLVAAPIVSGSDVVDAAPVVDAADVIDAVDVAAADVVDAADVIFAAPVVDAKVIDAAPIVEAASSVSLKTTQHASEQAAPIVDAVSSDAALPARAANGVSGRAAREAPAVAWISEIPWASSVVPAQAQFSAGAFQPLDPGSSTMNAGLSSRPSKESFGSDLQSALSAAGGRSGLGQPAPQPSASAGPESGGTPSGQTPTGAPIGSGTIAGAAPSTASPAANSLQAGIRQTAAAATTRAMPTSLQATPAVQVVATSEIQILGSSETAEILQESTSVQTVEVQRRSPIDFDPRIRGYRAGQVYTQSDGALWFPARQDLDSILSKIDPSLIQDAIVVPGPYGLRYGPGFGYIDIVTSPTPRFNDCPEVHYRTGLTVRENGGQLYGRETVYGGGADYGFIFNYGNRTGSDYEAGNGSLIPSSYHAQNLLGQIGFDTSDHTHWEFRYQRLDQTDTEYAGQFFDLGLLVSDGFSLKYVNEDPGHVWDRLEIDGWYNRTRFLGDTLNQSKRNFHVIDRVESALGLPTNGNPPSFVGQTNGALTSSGTRTQLVFGEEHDQELRIGADFRYLKQGLNEDFSVVGNDPFDTNLPRSESIDPGLYAELTFPLDEETWNTTIGARIDWVGTSAAAGDIRSNTSLPGIATSREQNDTLYAFYLVNDVLLLDDWTARFGFGHAQRAPTLIERYSDGLFLGIIQSGFSRVIGDPNLDKERLWQIDASTNWEVGDWEFRLSGFHAWVEDYITFTGNVINDPSGARLLRHINTDLATLAGAEFYTEKPLTERLTGFGAFHMVDGRDREIDRALFGISPVEGRAGLRLVDREDGKKWGVEFSARIVDNQDRLGGLRIGTNTVVNVVDLEVPTQGFTTFNARGYWNVTDSLHVVAGIDNMFDKNYLEHLSLRLPDVGGFTGTRVLEPGFSPYMTVEWTY